MTDPQREAWKSIVQSAPAGLLAGIDRSLVTALAIASANLVTASKELPGLKPTAAKAVQARINKAITQLVMLSNAIGISPPMRLRLSLDEPSAAEAAESDYNAIIASRPQWPKPH